MKQKYSSKNLVLSYTPKIKLSFFYGYNEHIKLSSSELLIVSEISFSSLFCAFIQKMLFCNLF